MRHVIKTTQQFRGNTEEAETSGCTEEDTKEKQADLSHRTSERLEVREPGTRNVESIG